MRRTLALAALGLALAAPQASAAPHGSAADGLPNLDSRSGERARVSAATRAARDDYRSRLGIEAAVANEPSTGGLRAAGRTDALLTGPQSGDPAEIALAYVRDHLDAFALAPADLDELDLAARYRSPDGVTHLTWQQRVSGIPAYDSVLYANVTRDGRLVNAGGGAAADLAPNRTAPQISATRALGIATQNVEGGGLPPRADRAPGPERVTTFGGDERARLVIFTAPDGDRLAWQVTVNGPDPYVYEVLIDAADGSVLSRTGLTQFVANASVVDNHPGAALGGTPHTVDLEADPAWLDNSAGDTRLAGRNAYVYADLNRNDQADGGEDTPTSGGGNFVYPPVGVAPAPGQTCPTLFTAPCTWNGTDRGSASVNQFQTGTQAFYFINTFHDWLRQPPIGFDDASHNFEYGGTGGDDPIIAETQDGGGFNNANMYTPRDGGPGRMQMYLYKNPAVSGADDASVVYHEYTHGLSNRLVGNGLGRGLSSSRRGAMGEGWSDWYALDYLVDEGIRRRRPGHRRRGLVGPYVATTPPGSARKAMDCPVGAVAARCGPTAVNTDPGGYTYGDLGRVAGFAADKPTCEVHADGEIWTQTLWDLRAARRPRRRRGPSSPAACGSRPRTRTSSTCATRSCRSHVCSAAAR